MSQSVALKIRETGSPSFFYGTAAVFALACAFWTVLAGLAVYYVGLSFYVMATKGTWPGVFILIATLVVAGIMWIPFWSFVNAVFNPVGYIGRQMGVRWVTESEDHAALVDEIHAMARTAGISAPPLIGVQPREFNAFAIGFLQSKSAVVLGSRLISELDEDELRAVIGHELGHIASRDCCASTMMNVIGVTMNQGIARPIALVMGLFGIGARVSSSANISDDRETQEGFSTAMVLVGAILFLFAGLFLLGGWLLQKLVELIDAAHSRSREFRADRSGALLTNKQAMIGALKRIQNYAAEADTLTADPYASFQFMNLKAAASGKEKAGLFDSHPPTGARIAALEDDQNLA